MEKIRISKKDNVEDQSISDIKQKYKIMKQSTLTQSGVFSQKDESSRKIYTQCRRLVKQKTHKKKHVMISKQQDNVYQIQQSSQCQTQNDILKLKDKDKSKYNKQSNIQNYFITSQNSLKSKFNNYRISNLKEHFINQLRKNSIFRKPIDFQPFQPNNNQNSYQGVRIHTYVLNMAYVISITHTILSCFFTSLLIVFKELYQTQLVKYLQYFGFIILLCQIILGFIRVRAAGTIHLVKINDICKSYLRSELVIDLICFISMILGMVLQNSFQNYLIAVLFLKVPDCIEKIAKIQTKLFDSFYWQQYCRLIKLLLTNFTYAHFIAIILLMMSWLDQNNSWLQIKQIVNSPWYEQYSWAYYWGTTVMLTVGFGDISAANYKEAICLVLIETISCMALAYNINCLGDLIKELKSKQKQKDKNLKILKKISDKKQLNPQINFKLTNYIKQIYKIQTKLSFKQESEFITKLPINLRQQFLRDINYKAVSKLAFFRNFTNKTIQALAQKLYTKMTHPDEIIFKVHQFNRLVILKQGEVGLFPNFNFNFSKNMSQNLKINKIAIDKFVVKQGKPSQLISLDFLQYPITKNYDVKSLTYSKIFQMEIQSMLQILKWREVDYQHYFTLRDKQKKSFQNFQLIMCEFCLRRHSKFHCPRLHYIPTSQNVIYKYLHKYKVQKNKRKLYRRHKKQLSNCLVSYKRIEAEIISKTHINLDTKSQVSNSDSEIMNGGFSGVSVNKLIPSNKQRSNILFKKMSLISNNKIQDMTENNLKSRTNFSRPSSHQNTFMLQMMKKQIGNIFNNQDIQNQFWDLQTDQAKNYKFYFVNFNPKNIQITKLKKNTPPNPNATNLTKSKSFNTKSRSVNRNFS